MWKLVRRKTVRRPTLLGWLLLALLAAFGLRFLAPRLHRFLAVSDPPAGQALIVEGWINDEQLAALAEKIRSHPYREIYFTGGPIETGSALIGFDTWAHVGAERLALQGIPRDRLTVVPAGRVSRDRTHASALALKSFLKDRPGPNPRVFDLATADTHARRSRLVFRKALGRETEIRVIGLPNPRMGEGAWWHTSEGFRAVLYEWLAYGYTRVWLLGAPD